MTARVLVTGAAGYLGGTLVEALAPRLADRTLESVVATDVRETEVARRRPGVEYLRLDVRDPALGDVLAQHAVDTVVHLAAIVTPGPASNRALEYSVDVDGTRNVLEGCRRAGVRRIVVTSSGAAYGYHADNPAWIGEDWPVRGNEAFAYSHHKRLVEEMLAAWRRDHPELGQLVLRVGTILGETTRNQITALFEKPRLIAIRGSASPFVFVWDRDVVGAIEHGLLTGRNGIYNVAGDGALTIHEIAARLGKRCVELPPGLLRAALAVLHPLGLSRYGPEQVDFLRYRPVLDNRRLKEEFGYRPRYTSAEVFELFRRARGLGPAS
ncbi:MAG: SDR family oxidoreductase [Steroidobacteraceae bacterium]